MDVRYPTIYEAATPEYILAVIQDNHRQQCQYDPEADPGALLSFATTVEEWRSSCDLVRWKQLGRALNAEWGISCSDADWYAVLEPAAGQRLADVCQFVAARAVRPVIRPARLLGGNCVPAGAFLTIRSLLHEVGVQTAAEISPSTPLAPYARRYGGVFLGPISRLAPGSLPLVHLRSPGYFACLWGALVGLVCLPFGICTGLHVVTSIGVLSMALGYALTGYAARRPASVTFGELRTFRDLSVIIADGKQA